MPKLIERLKHPGSDVETDFVVMDDRLVDQKNKISYPILQGMVDFQRTFEAKQQKPERGFFFKLNTYYSHHLDSWILSSIFAGGGIGFIKADRKLKQWIDQHMHSSEVLFIEPENRHQLSFIDPQMRLTVKDYSQKNVEPLPEHYPDLNASPELLPIVSSSFEHVISNFVFEHIKRPRHHMREIERILKPGGLAIITGPGDVYPSHKVPFNYFNIVRYGYLEMFRENNLTLIEEYYPFKSWMSILYNVYITSVRNSWFNTNQFTKFLQMFAFLISVVIFPVLNLLALFFDLITPFDQRVYGAYMALVQKSIQPDNKTT
jgi:hypothetical protein